MNNRVHAIPMPNATPPDEFRPRPRPRILVAFANHDDDFNIERIFIDNLLLGC